MYRLLQQDRPLSQGVLRAWRQIFLILILVTAVIWSVKSVGNMFTPNNFWTGLLQLTGGLAILSGFSLGTLALTEILNAQHRLNDRMTLLGDDMRRLEKLAGKTKIKKRVAAGKPAPKAPATPTPPEA